MQGALPRVLSAINMVKPPTFASIIPDEQLDGDFKLHLPWLVGRKAIERDVKAARVIAKMHASRKHALLSSEEE
jgi:hypothetical protein